METEPPAPPAPTPEETQGAPLIQEVEKEIASLWARGLGFVGPILLFLLPIPIVWWVRPDIAPLTMAFYVTVPLGVDVASVTAVGAAAAAGQSLHWWYIFVWIMWGQMLLTAFLLWNLHLLRRWKRADRFLTKQEARAQEAYGKHAWLRNFHFWGLAAFTVLPVGSGVYVGILLGKGTGLADLKTWSALMLGTAIWTAILTWGLVSSSEFVLRILN